MTGLSRDDDDEIISSSLEQRRVLGGRGGKSAKRSSSAGVLIRRALRRQASGVGRVALGDEGSGRRSRGGDHPTDCQKPRGSCLIELAGLRYQLFSGKQRDLCTGVRLLLFLVAPALLLLAGPALCDGLALPRPGQLLRDHAALLDRARSLSAEASAEGAGGEGSVSWQRLWHEVHETQQARLVVPASALSLCLCASELAAPRVRGRVFDAVLEPGARLGTLAPHLRTLALLALGGWLANIISSVLFASARWQASMTGRVKLMDAVLAQEPGFFDRQPPGELASRLITEPERLQELANRGPEKLLTALVSLVGGALLMFSTEWRLALLAVSLRAPLLTQLAVLAGRTVGLYGALQQHTLNQANSLAAEALSQPLTVAALAARPQVLKSYRKRVGDYLGVIRATLLSETALRFTQLALDSATQQLLLLCGVTCVLRGRLSVGALTAFFANADTFAQGCRSAQELLHQAFELRPLCARHFALLDREPRMAWDAPGGAAPAQCRGALSLRGVSFRFPGRAGAALRNVTLEVPAGATLAVVGPSGSGKSTLLKLLARLYDPDEGEVRWDGLDAREWDLACLRTRCGYVPQEPLLFDASLRDNLGFGVRGAPPSDAELHAALAAAGIPDLVAELPHGLESMLGEGGRALSGGQRQRVVIARALVREPRVLLWDEATSALDVRTERRVLEGLWRGRGRRTAVLVAHRLESISSADLVAVLRRGELVELGSPAELARAGGWFAANFGAGAQQQQQQEQQEQQQEQQEQQGEGEGEEEERDGVDDAG